jgi:uracil-DNA glycosylase family 4
LHSAAESVCIPASGPDDAKILFYGEGPGGEEDKENEPFIGPAGQELDVLLGEAGLSRKRVRVSNTVRCRPPGNRDPSEDERAACMLYTVREIEAVKPKIIIALGVSALKALTGIKKIGDSRGKLLSLLPQYRSDVPVIATYHPAAYLHNPGMRGAYSKSIIEDMRLAQKVVSGSVMRAKIVTSLNKGAVIRRTLKRLAKCDVLGCDLEWEVLPSKKKDPLGMWPWSARRGKRPRPVSIAIAGRVDDKILALSVPFTSEYADDVRQIIRRVPTIYHNAMADLIWLYHLGWKVKLDSCTFILASLLKIDSSLSLKVLAPMLTDMPVGWERDDSGMGIMPVSRDEWRRKLKYGGYDAIATFLLKPKLLELVHEQKRDDVLPLYHHVLLPATEILARTALSGTPIDQPLLKSIRTKVLRRVSVLTEKIGDELELPADYEAIISSDMKLAPYLERVGVDLPRTRKTDRPSVTNDVLLKNKKAHTVIPPIITRRQLTKQESGYWRPWTWLLETQRDKRLHTIYRLSVASTGRSSTEGEIGYTFQQFLRGKKFRRLVQARKGWEILSVDQSQIELRIVAWLAQERRMLEFFRDDKDLHTAIAGWMKALEAGWTIKKYIRHMEQWTGDVTRAERTGAKPINFGLLFGGGPSVVQKTARKDYGIILSDEQSEVAYDAYHIFYPDVRPWQETFWRDVKRGYGETSLGRRRSVREDEEGPDGVWRKYINLDVQATASDLSLFCMDYTWELLRKEFGRHLRSLAENIGFFHDATLIHLDREVRSEVGAIVRESWEHPPLDRIGLEMDVPLKADIKIRERWTT